MSKPCPKCGEHNFHVQTTAVVQFDGEHIVNPKQILCDIEENENGIEFLDAFVICNDCEWTGKVRDLQVQRDVMKPGRSDSHE